MKWGMHKFGIYLKHVSHVKKIKKSCLEYYVILSYISLLEQIFVKFCWKQDMAMVNILQKFSAIQPQFTSGIMTLV